MDMGTSHIIVCSDVASLEQDQLLNMLSEFGQITTLDLNNAEHLEKFELNSSYSVLVLLLSDAEKSRAAVLKLLSAVGSIPVIGLFSNTESTWDKRILSACVDVASWPCSKQELSFRLRKNVGPTGETHNLGNRLFLRMSIFGESPEFLKVLDKVSKITRCDAPVFIDGETGTGKELIARAVHYLSDRKDQPFIATNCGAVPDQLIENEFFGHQKGAYTDARESVDGIIAQAEGGSLFLDEIETLSQKGQVALLRFLENMSYRPLGGNSTKTANIRIITATNESLSKMVESGEFRKDLYYRVNIMSIELPPLRARSGDVNLLAEHFVRQYQVQYKQPYRRLHPNTLAALKYHDWPGNVRELENMIHREFLLADSDLISIDQIESATRERRSSAGDRRLGNMFGQPLVEAKHNLINDFEQQYLSSTLDRAKGNISEAARMAGKERRSFTRLLEKYELTSSSYKNH